MPLARLAAPALAAAFLAAWPAAAGAAPPPSASASATGIALRCTAIQPRKVSCRATAAGPLTWSFGNGRTATGPSVTVRYTRAGSYFLRVKSTTTAGEPVERIALVHVTRTQITVRLRG